MESKVIYNSLQYCILLISLTMFSKVKNLLSTSYEAWWKVLFSQACVIHSVHSGVIWSGVLPFLRRGVSHFSGGISYFFRRGGGSPIFREGYSIFQRDILEKIGDSPKYWKMVNVRSVRSLLECILVFQHEWTSIILKTSMHSSRIDTVCSGGRLVGGLCYWNSPRQRPCLSDRHTTDIDLSRHRHSWTVTPLDRDSPPQKGMPFQVLDYLPKNETAHRNETPCTQNDTWFWKQYLLRVYEDTDTSPSPVFDFWWRQFFVVLKL